MTRQPGGSSGPWNQQVGFSIQGGPQSFLRLTELPPSFPRLPLGLRARRVRDCLPRGNLPPVSPSSPPACPSTSRFLRCSRFLRALAVQVTSEHLPVSFYFRTMMFRTCFRLAYNLHPTVPHHRPAPSSQLPASSHHYQPITLHTGNRQPHPPVAGLHSVVDWLWLTPS